jgi:hypothetical protein
VWPVKAGNCAANRAQSRQRVEFLVAQVSGHDGDRDWERARRLADIAGERARSSMSMPAATTDVTDFLYNRKYATFSLQAIRTIRVVIRQGREPGHQLAPGISLQL